jgi:hypothetical protein
LPDRHRRARKSRERWAGDQQRWGFRRAISRITGRVGIQRLDAATRDRRRKWDNEERFSWPLMSPRVDLSGAGIRQQERQGARRRGGVTFTSRDMTIAGLAVWPLAPRLVGQRGWMGSSGQSQILRLRPPRPAHAITTRVTTRDRHYAAEVRGPTPWRPPVGPAHSDHAGTGNRSSARAPNHLSISASFARPPLAISLRYAPNP